MPFSAERLQRNLEALAFVAPEVARWLKGQRANPNAAETLRRHCCRRKQSLPAESAREGDITLVLGGGLLDEVGDFLRRMPAGHQVFLLEPRAWLLLAALGRHDLSGHLGQEDLVIMAPGEASLEEALSRNPQLALGANVRLVHLYLAADEPACRQASAALYHLWGRALCARDLALSCESHSAENLVGNLVYAAFMGAWSSLAGALRGAPAVLLLAGPGLEPAIEALRGHLGGAALFCDDEALPAILNAGITPTAAGVTRCQAGPLLGFDHPNLPLVPLVAEEIAHSATLAAHPGSVFPCLGPRGTALGPLAGMAKWFTAQHHPLPRLAELALLAGCAPLIVAGGDMADPTGDLCMSAVGGGLTQANMAQAAAAGAFGRVLARYDQTAFNAGQGLELPRTVAVDLLEVAKRLGGPGQPPRLAALEGETLLSPAELDAYGQALGQAALTATRFWQRAAAPLADYPRRAGRQAHLWLNAADALFVALSDQAAADPMLSALLEGCLVRAFRRRHRLACWAASRSLPVEEAARQLQSCLEEMRARVGKLAGGLQKMSQDMRRLAHSLGRVGPCWGRPPGKASA